MGTPHIGAARTPSSVAWLVTPSKSLSPLDTRPPVDKDCRDEMIDYHTAIINLQGQCGVQTPIGKAETQ